MMSVHSGLLMAETQLAGFTDCDIQSYWSHWPQLTGRDKRVKKVHQTAVGRDSVLPNEFKEGVSDEFGRVCNFASRLIEGHGIVVNVSDIPD